MVFNFMRTVTLLTFDTMCIVDESGMFSLPIILALRNAKVHVGFSDSCNILSYIETSVNKILSLCTILRVPNINLYNSYI